MNNELAEFFAPLEHPLPHPQPEIELMPDYRDVPSPEPATSGPAWDLILMGGAIVIFWGCVLWLIFS